MKTTETDSSVRPGRAIPGSSILQSSRYGLPWAFGAFAIVVLVGGVMAVDLWKHTPGAMTGAAAGGNRVVLTANAAPPALWSNTWLGRRPYRSVAFHGLRRFATGFGLSTLKKPHTLSEDLLRAGPAISSRFVHFRDEVSAEAEQSLAAKAWL